MLTLKSIKPCIKNNSSSYIYTNLFSRVKPVKTDYFKKYSTNTHFFQTIRQSGANDLKSMVDLLKNEYQLKKTLDTINQGNINSYLHENFIFWLNAYAISGSSEYIDYLSGQVPLNSVCQDFVRFCFRNNIHLDPTRTLDSFKKHNELCDAAVRKELDEIRPQEKINLLGFGLDEGIYEKQIAAHLISSGKAKKVDIFGFDPYAKKSLGIQYLSESDLYCSEKSFDLVVARWVLHHVELRKRWSTLINCLNSCHSGAHVLIIEHGYLDGVSEIDRRFNGLLNAIFDVVANIGLRPRYFLNSRNMGDDFFIQYLEPSDFDAIKRKISMDAGISFYDVGPNFPNQTICKISIK